MDINDRILHIIATLKLTQKDFAARVGLHQTSITHLKQKVYEPTAKNILKICTVFHINPNWLITGNGEMFNKEESEKISIDQIILILQKLQHVNGSDFNKILTFIDELTQSYRDKKEKKV